MVRPLPRLPALVGGVVFPETVGELVPLKLLLPLPFPLLTDGALVAPGTVGTLVLLDFPLLTVGAAVTVVGAAVGSSVMGTKIKVGDSEGLGVGDAVGDAVGVSEGAELVDGVAEGGALIVGGALDVGVPVVGAAEGTALMEGVPEGKELGVTVGFGVTTS